MTKSVCIIGDIHGCFKTLKALIKQLPKDATLCFVGDLIDRGSNSMDVVDFVIANDYDCVKGNHEDMASKASNSLMFNQNDILIGTGWDYHIWTRNGGFQALRSYETIIEYPEGTIKLDFNKSKFDNHISWMEKLPIYKSYPDIKDKNGRYLVVSHSLILPYWKYKHRKDSIFADNVIWNRHGFIEFDNKEIFNVFGHTPHDYANIKLRKNYCCIDTGCVFKNDKQYGILTALQFPEMKFYSQNNID